MIYSGFINYGFVPGWVFVCEHQQLPGDGDVR